MVEPKGKSGEVPGPTVASALLLGFSEHHTGIEPDDSACAHACVHGSCSMTMPGVGEGREGGRSRQFEGQFKP